MLIQEYPYAHNKDHSFDLSDIDAMLDSHELNDTTATYFLFLEKFMKEKKEEEKNSGESQPRCAPADHAEIAQMSKRLLGLLDTPRQVPNANAGPTSFARQSLSL